ncbi:adenylyltransferase/cytidyltransferase family protein [Nesterenkonia sp. MY13]|uniref:Adenylyltransferase/cytidyltransferase family protein n=1 Tax=Nesterenkonia sedimenti TaxID=1463632 RepID=A0A7X8TLR6_9MICC|nr:adenylyltransferase/cytidyltransferase family protein [Nesterenkonia sedimenti]NLS10935.1 adenylyltransferase/cytidyltransferase family protein [Nesterenkonia sedimenti]
MKRVLTYGTFDLLHWGHIRLLKRAKSLGDYLIVGASTDEFATEDKGVRAPYHKFETRCDMLSAVRYVDLVIPEARWDQKLKDIQRYQADVVVMGSDWAGSHRFEYLRDHVDLVFLPRTEGVSTSKIRRDLLAEAVSLPTGQHAENAGEPAPVTSQMAALPRTV